jgi:uncharacterized membrane protein YbhN (UPF0104 family)
MSRRAETRWVLLRPLTGLLHQVSQAISSLASPSLLGRLIALSVSAWLAEGAAFLLVGYALGMSISLAVALLALAVGTLSTIIPSSPGYVGTFHYFTAVTIGLFGFGQAESAAYAVAIHGLLWASTTACGLILLTTTGLGSALRSLPDQQANP